MTTYHDEIRDAYYKKISEADALARAYAIMTGRPINEFRTIAKLTTKRGRKTGTSRRIQEYLLEQKKEVAADKIVTHFKDSKNILSLLGSMARKGTIDRPRRGFYAARQR